MAQLESMRRFFLTGATRSYDFRRKQLLLLRDGLRAAENDLFAALRADLNKSPEECWATENGLVLAELNFALGRLKKWMHAERVGTNLVNFPSRSYVIREPKGTVLIVGPWNYPVQLLLNPLVGSIAAGNCSVLKPSEFTPEASRVLKKIITDTFPADYILFLEGEGRQVLPPMLDNFSFDHIFFTGSTQVGKEIYRKAAEKLVPVTLELGGKSPCVVEADANIRVAAKRIALTKFSNAGQMCVAPDYILVHESRKSEFLNSLSQFIRNFFGKNYADNYNYGRIINDKQFDRLQEYLSSGKVYAGGGFDRSRLSIEPTILTDVPLEAKIMNDEIFGPILPVYGFREKTEALAIINRHPDPLSFYVYTDSKQKEKDWISSVPAGGTCINNSSWHLTNPHLPFGGRGHSGMGLYHGKYSFDTFSHIRAVMKTPTWFDPKLKYPPFEGRLKLYKKFIR